MILEDTFTLAESKKSWSQVMPASKYGHYYIWTRYPSPKDSKFKISALNFDTPSLVLFFLTLVTAVALMKIFTILGSRLGLQTASEEPLMIPTR